MADHVALQEQVPLKDLRIQLTTKYPEFAIIRDVADATKHARLDRKDAQMKSSEQVSGTPGLFASPFGEGVFLEASRVIVTLDDGKTLDLEPAIRSVTAMWEAYLSEG